jgi:hypothetical protein
MSLFPPAKRPYSDGCSAASPYYQDRRWVVVLPAAVKGEVRAFPEGLEKYPESSVKMKGAA